MNRTIVLKERNNLVNNATSIYEERGRLLINCSDQPGIIAAVSSHLRKHGANIIESNQYSTNPEGGQFFLRIEFHCPDLPNKCDLIRTEFKSIAEQFQMTYKIIQVSQKKRTAIYVSKESHCLMELLWEWQNGDLDTDIALVISNHEDSRELVESFGIPFHHIPAHKSIRQEADAKQIELMKKYDIDLLVLAQSMQILTPHFVSQFPNQIINIHHSFLPAFIGAYPYERAYNRGVKLIGATSHYVTDDLDEGPIIEQDIERVDHRDNVQDLKNIGRKIERRVLAHAVKWHLEDRVIVYGNKTVVFQ